MKKYLSLVLAIIIALDVWMSFVRNNAVENVFGIELNVWVYRVLWSLLAILLFVNFIGELKKEKTTEK